MHRFRSVCPSLDQNKLSTYVLQPRKLGALREVARDNIYKMWTSATMHFPPKNSKNKQLQDILFNPFAALASKYLQIFERWSVNKVIWQNIHRLLILLQV